MSAWEGLTPPYSTITADPPWEYNDSPLGDFQGGRMTRFLPYPSMTIEAITAMSVQSLASPGAHLYLWTTNRYLVAAHEVARQWGFSPLTVLVWCKSPHGLGPGGRFSITTEFVLFCRDTRIGETIRAARETAGLSRGDLHRLVRGGKPTGIVFRWEADDCLPTPDDWEKLQSVLPALAGLPYPDVVASEKAKADSTWWNWPRGAHSAKPAAFYDLVERVSPGPYVELFARAPRLGWDHWGHGYETAVA